MRFHLNGFNHLSLVNREMLSWALKNLFKLSQSWNETKSSSSLLRWDEAIFRTSAGEWWKSNSFFSPASTRSFYLYVFATILIQQSGNFSTQNSLLEANCCLRIVAVLVEWFFSVFKLPFLCFTLLIRFRCQNICFYLHQLSQTFPFLRFIPCWVFVTNKGFRSDLGNDKCCNILLCDLPFIARVYILARFMLHSMSSRNWFAFLQTEDFPSRT